MYLYKICMQGYDECSILYLVHRHKFDQTQLRRFIDDVIIRHKRSVIEQEIASCRRAYEWELEYFAGDSEMMQYVRDKAQHGHDVRFDDIWHVVLETLISENGFVEFKFDAELDIRDDEVIGHTGPISLDDDPK